jgi:predicted acyltransferase
VLQRIALCYLFSGLLFLYLKPRALVGAFVGILVGYWALMSFVPVPGHGAGNFAEGSCNMGSSTMPQRDKFHESQGQVVCATRGA